MAGFHQDRLSASPIRPPLAGVPLQLTVREAASDQELEAAAVLRAKSFYRYPEERKFAGELHQAMVAEEEFKELRARQLRARLHPEDGEHSACVVALCPAGEVPEEADPRLLLPSSGSSNDAGGGGAEGSAGQVALVGTLDVHAVRALPGEVLIGNSQNAAYLANVCSSAAARRRRVGLALINAARAQAKAWGAEDLYVHTMAVNEIALRFYERCGFVVEKEESSNDAHYRGRCLDGIEGRGRTVLLRDAHY